MARGRTRHRNTVGILNQLWATGFAIVLAVSFGIYALNRYGGLGREDPHLLVSVLALSTTTVILFVRYLTATQHELGLLDEYLGGPSAPRPKMSVHYNILLLALVFGLLISVSHLILVYSALIVIYNLVDIWSGWLVRRAISPLFQKKPSGRVSAKERGIIETLRQYYLDNPVFERAATQMFVNCAAFSQALVAYYTRIVWCRDGAYLLVILNVLGGELVIHRWRPNRDRQIEALEAAINHEQ